MPTAPPPAPLPRVFPRLLFKTGSCAWVQVEAFGVGALGQEDAALTPGSCSQPCVIGVNSRDPGPKSWTWF